MGGAEAKKCPSFRERKKIAGAVGFSMCLMVGEDTVTAKGIAHALPVEEDRLSLPIFRKGEVGELHGWQLAQKPVLPPSGHPPLARCGQLHPHLLILLTMVGVQSGAPAPHPAPQLYRPLPASRHCGAGGRSLRRERWGMGKQSGRQRRMLAFQKAIVLGWPWEMVGMG